MLSLLQKNWEYGKYVKIVTIWSTDLSIADSEGREEKEE